MYVYEMYMNVRNVTKCKKGNYMQRYMYYHKY